MLDVGFRCFRLDTLVTNAVRDVVLFFSFAHILVAVYPFCLVLLYIILQVISMLDSRFSQRSIVAAI